MYMCVYDMFTWNRQEIHPLTKPAHKPTQDWISIHVYIYTYICNVYDVSTWNRQEIHPLFAFCHKRVTGTELTKPAHKPTLNWVSIHLHIYTYVYIYVYVYMYVYMCIHICICVYMICLHETDKKFTLSSHFVTRKYLAVSWLIDLKDQR